METFKWCIRPDFQVDNEPTVNFIEFGDGYAQRQLQGINSLLRSYSVSVKVKTKTAWKWMNSLKDTKEFILFFKDPFTGKVSKLFAVNGQQNGFKLHRVYL